MSLNAHYLTRLEKEIAEPAAEVAEHLAEVALKTAGPMVKTEQIKTDDDTGQADSEPGESDEPVSTELQELRTELAAKAAEIAALKTAKDTGTATSEADDIELYESEEERNELVNGFGEEIVALNERVLKRALSGVQAKAEAKINALEKYKQSREQSESSAEFVKAAGSEALKTFNDPKFQAFAKGERLGRKSLFDELADIVSNNDASGIEFLAQQTAAFESANKTTRKAQVGAGKSPVTTSASPSTFDPEKAKKLERDMKSHRAGTPKFKAAAEKLRAYLAD
jgi:hypothetical protein